MLRQRRQSHPSQLEQDHRATQVHNINWREAVTYKCTVPDLKKLDESDRHQLIIQALLVRVHCTPSTLLSLHLEGRKNGTAVHFSRDSQNSYN